MSASPRHSKIFLVDDSAPIRSRIAAMLGSQDNEVVGEAASPQGAIEGILATHPDVVVLDVQLEGGYGLEVLRAVHQALPQVAFVVFSNNAGPAYRKRYLKEGAFAFLDKSGELDQLASAVVSARQSHCHH